MMVDIWGSLARAWIIMGPMAIVAALVAMYFWERTCRTKIKVVLVKDAGGTATYIVDKEGDYVHLENPKTGWAATWPISNLVTIPRAYPDLAGILPKFLQREIQEAIYIEGDLEPVLNRSPHRERVMSPDRVNALLALKETHPGVSGEIDAILEGVSTGPTRELVASPDWVGSLRKSTALKALASVSDDLMEALNKIHNQLARFAGLNSTYVYIGIVLILILMGVNLYYTIQSANAGVTGIPPDVMQKIDAIYYNVMGSK